METKNISPETQTIVLELTGKFGPKGFIRKLFGRNTEGSNVSFDGKAKVLKGGTSGDTASKIKALPQDSSLSNMLMKIYSFLQKNSEVDKLSREKENNFKEIEEGAAQKRHEKLLAALEKLKKNLGVGTDSLEPVVQESTSLFDRIFDSIGGVAGILRAVRFLTPLLMSPAGILIIAALAAGSFAKFLAALRERDKKLRPEDYKDVPSEIADREGITKGAAGAQNQRKALKQIRASEIKDALEAKPNLTDDELINLYGKNRAELTDWLKTNPKGVLQVNPTATPVTPSTTPATTSPASTPEVTPASTTPVNEPTELPPVSTPSEKLNSVVSQNNDAKINSMGATPSVSTINNMQTAGKTKTKALEKLDVPHVRNQEETFQKMILYSTRVV